MLYKLMNIVDWVMLGVCIYALYVMYPHIVWMIW
jgi:hypothetical protein